MHRIVKILLPVLLLVFSTSLFAQQKVNGKTEGQQPGKNSAAPSRVLMPDTYLGRSGRNGGAITKPDFDNLLRQGITSRDSLGNKYKVIGFFFGYGERSLYEDEAGNLQTVRDYLEEYCAGDTITANVSGSIYERTKPGDTVYIDRVKVLGYIKKTTQLQPESNEMLSKPMKFAIIK
jgi:hypothetical protein